MGRLLARLYSSHPPVLLLSETLRGAASDAAFRDCVRIRGVGLDRRGVVVSLMLPETRPLPARTRGALARVGRDGCRRHLDWPVVRGRAGPDAAHPKSLTPIEGQAFALASAGHSNRAIACELGLSAPRVSRLVSGAMTKLGIGSRAELASYAPRPALNPRRRG